MTKEEILAAASMPACSSSYPFGPYRFLNREYFIISYRTDPAIIRKVLPEPIEPPTEPIIHYEWIRMPDSAGFGNYTESGLVIPGILNGEPINFVAEMFLDDLAPIVAGREIWGFPKEYAQVELKTVKDTLVGTLAYAEERIATGTMMYKVTPCDMEYIRQSMARTQINLKLIPDVDGKPAIAQLVAINLAEIEVLGAWEGMARLHLIPHAHARMADFPVHEVVHGRHFISHLTLPYGRVVYDYLKE
ncbi:MAG: acetoacetate decarboxylase [Bacteroidia bacterium]|nr:acetoacetate decarboxylase [Bacteroidia bacterium]